jgi:four helix bundle protein
MRPSNSLPWADLFSQNGGTFMNEDEGRVRGRGGSGPEQSQPMFDHEKLDVYQLEMGFVAWATTLLLEVKHAAQGFHREVCDQLERASLSALLNTAEGNGKRQGKVRAKFFDDARGSAVECAACLDALVAKRLVTRTRVIEGKAMLLRIVSMLTRLVERFDSGASVVEEERQAAYLFRPRPSSSFSSSGIRPSTRVVRVTGGGSS